jgi:hypothetical protein
MRHKWCSLLAIVSLLTASSLSAQSSVIFVTDENGHIGRYDTVTNVGTALGSLAASGFSPGQVIGLAYNPASNQLLIFDRSVAKVYAMDAMTGVASVLFSTGAVSFQGGAVLNGLIYGIDEGAQNLEAYTFSGLIQNLPGPSISAHVHSLAVNPITGELFFHTSSTGVRVVSTSGIEGAVLLAGGLMGGLGSEDIDYFNGNYLVADYSTQLYLVNGTTGANTVFLNSAQLTGMGVIGALSGVAVQMNAVPEPGTWALLLTGLAAVALTGLRRRR